jgi:transcriptional regulator with XRE-family HTH domain
MRIPQAITSGAAIKTRSLDDSARPAHEPDRAPPIVCENLRPQRLASAFHGADGTPQIPIMPIRFDDIGNRLRAFRLGANLSADEIAKRIGISRAALYRFEKGELVKIETLEKLAELLGVSVPTLLGVGVEYIPSAVSYFERVRQIEETAEHIIVLAGPISYLLSSSAFDDELAQVLRESVPDALPDRKRALADVAEIMAILRQRRAAYQRRRPAIVNLISAAEIERFLVNGLIGRLNLPEKVRRERRAHARVEVAHLAKAMADEPIGLQIGIVPDTLPHASFQIFRQPDRQILVTSPFRLGEQPNVRIGVAMITSALEALALHQLAAEEMWRRALKGPAAAKHLRDLMARHRS